MSRYCLARCATPAGEMLLASEGAALVGAWFAGQRHFAASLPAAQAAYAEAEPLRAARAWLAAYFSGQWPIPAPLPPLAPIGTLFQAAVWRALLCVPYGHTTTYGALAAELSRRSGARTSPRAVGHAVGRNPISILIPCHRVLGAGGALTGYAAGLQIKQYLLRLEGCALVK